MSVKWRPFCLGLNVLMEKPGHTQSTQDLQRHMASLGPNELTLDEG